MSRLRSWPGKERHMGSRGRVKLLLDENISRRIVPALQEAFPGSTQVVLAGLERVDDRAVWEYAKANEYVILSKDDDFLSFSPFLAIRLNHSPQARQLH